MALPLVPNVYRCAIGWKVGADTVAENILHFNGAGGASGADLATSASNIAAALAADAPFVGAFGPHVTFESITLTDLGSVAEASGEGFATGVGTRTGSPLSSGACALIRLGISRRYKGGKPRSYMPWGTSADLDAVNHWSSGAITAFDTAYASMITYIETFSGTAALSAQINLGYFSGYTLGPAQPGGFRKKIPTPLGAPHKDVITSVSASPNVGSQRRRNRA